ncbi:MAG: 3-methyl-2-oxobutanoate hydroxymethyltransferase [Anaerolineae bacterium]|nr:MAG: 3-methyl-2-oxobutanoate hydroxymethyltransferase [Anaerolineae bacterium]
MDKVTLQQLQAMKERGEPISMLTAYDYPSGLLADQSGVDMILVGDSLGMVVHGFESTLPVTMDMMVLHTQAVRRGVKRAFLVGDMPFMSYQASRDEALRNAGRFLKEGNADAIKLEGGIHMAETVHDMVQVGIAVMGHIGLTPQSVSAFGGFKVQVKAIEAARKLIEDAKAIEAAGAFAMVIEGVPAKLGELITRMVSIPKIGIGAGGGTDGQVLVMHDILGMFDRFTPKFVKQYAKIGEAIQNVFTTFHQEVRSGAFPTPEHEFGISDAVLNEILAEIGDTAH